MRSGVVAAKHHQEINYGLFETADIILIVGTVFILALFKNFACFGNYELRLVKSTGIIGS